MLRQPNLTRNKVFFLTQEKRESALKRARNLARRADRDAPFQGPFSKRVYLQMAEPFQGPFFLLLQVELFIFLVRRSAFRTALSNIWDFKPYPNRKNKEIRNKSSRYLVD